MIVDASALLAIVFAEPDADRLIACMAAAETLRMPCATWFEACTVIDRRGAGAHRAAFDAFVAQAGIIVEPLTYAHMQVARDAWARYGRGAHPAGLNFGDCMVYGFAHTAGEPLLFKGRDFSQTDIEPALED